MVLTHIKCTHSSSYPQHASLKALLHAPNYPITDRPSRPNSYRPSKYPPSMANLSKPTPHTSPQRHILPSIFVLLRLSSPWASISILFHARTNPLCHPPLSPLTMVQREVFKQSLLTRSHGSPFKPVASLGQKGEDPVVAVVAMGVDIGPSHSEGQRLLQTHPVEMYYCCCSSSNSAQKETDG